MDSKWYVLAALAAGLMMASNAHADWTFSSVSGGTSTTYNPDGTGPAGVTVTLSGAYAANGGTLTSGAIGGTIASGTTYGIDNFAAGATWTVNSKSNLAYYSGNGLGMSSDSTGSNQPNHALDNGVATDANDKISGLGNTESVLLSFNSSVVLSSIGIGYKFGDADISLFRYTNTSAPTLSGTTATLAGMTAAGWELVGNYGDLAVDTTIPYNAVNSGGKGSSWWLISAYNSSYGAATTGSVGQGNDFFKLYAVAGQKCTGSSTLCATPPQGAAPEPGSLALVSLALAGGVVSTRRRVAAGRAALA